MQVVFHIITTALGMTYYRQIIHFRAPYGNSQIKINLSMALKFPIELKQLQRSLEGN